MDKLAKLFDFQHFQQNTRLAAILADVESRYTNALADDDLEQVSAAGAAQPIKNETMILLLPDCQEEQKP